MKQNLWNFAQQLAARLREERESEENYDSIASEVEVWPFDEDENISELVDEHAVGDNPMNSLANYIVKRVKETQYEPETVTGDLSDWNTAQNVASELLKASSLDSVRESVEPELPDDETLLDKIDKARQKDDSHERLYALARELRAWRESQEEETIEEEVEQKETEIFEEEETEEAEQESTTPSEPNYSDVEAATEEEEVARDLLEFYRGSNTVDINEVRSETDLRLPSGAVLRMLISDMPEFGPQEEVLSLAEEIKHWQEEGVPSGRIMTAGPSA